MLPSAELKVMDDGDPCRRPPVAYFALFDVLPVKKKKHLSQFFVPVLLFLNIGHPVDFLTFLKIPRTRHPAISPILKSNSHILPPFKGRYQTDENFLILIFLVNFEFKTNAPLHKRIYDFRKSSIQNFQAYFTCKKVGKVCYM